MSGAPGGNAEKNPTTKVTRAMIRAGVAALEDELVEGGIVSFGREALVRHVFLDMELASRAGLSSRAPTPRR